VCAGSNFDITKFNTKMQSFMKTRTTYFLAILFVQLFLFSANMWANPKLEDPFGGIPIPRVDGTNATSSLMSVATTANKASVTLAAVVLGDDLNISWSRSIGGATLQIENENGEIVFQTSVNTSYTSSYAIDVTGWESGNYIITLTGSTVAEQGFSL
jgi:hypothetical protein